MKVILEIGYYKYLLPSEVGVSTLLKTLAKAQKVEHDYDEEGNRYTYVEELVDVSVQFVPKEKEPLKGKKLLGLPENGHRED